MKIRHLSYYLFMALMALNMSFVLTACGSDDDEDEGGGNTPTPTITLLSQSIQEGAEVVASATTVLTLGYNTTVQPVTNGDITFIFNKCFILSYP